MPISTTSQHDDSSPDPEEVAARRVGEVFAGKWHIDRVLGSGGMATVYAATHTNNQRAVALKVLHPDLTASGDIKKRFLREGFIANRIGHPGAVAILDDGVDDEGNVFLVMELLLGASVADRIRAARGKAPGDPPRRAFDQAEALRIADGVLDVLNAAHAQEIVHRDLKPDNVFVTDAGEVKVLDFGIARLREPQSGETPTRTGVVLGTPQYMPPEQARGRASLVDARSDLWAVGAIVFTMLTGRHVHEAETPNEALLKAMTATAQPLSSIVPDVSAKVAAIVDRALSYDAANRYPDARAMQEDVRAAMALLGAGRSDLAPASGGSGGALSGPRPVTAVTRSAIPLVRDARSGGSSGWRVLTVVFAIGVTAFVGRAFVVRFAPRVALGPEASGSVDAAIPGAGAAAMALPVTDAAASPLEPWEASAPAAAATDVSALLDAGADGDAGDAEADEEDDDGGEEEDEVAVDTPLPPPGHAATRAATPVRHTSSPPRKADPHADPHKKRKKKKHH